MNDEPFYDQRTHDPQYVKAIWRGPAGYLTVNVWIIAYSLGATRAFCILHIDSATAGNYSMCWLPSAQLQIADNSAYPQLTPLD